jgi:hypothetical protein
MDEQKSTRPNEPTAEDMTREEKRRDQLLAAPDSVEADAAPRIEVSEHDGNTRIDIADTAAVRPGSPPTPEEEA